MNLDGIDAEAFFPGDLTDHGYADTLPATACRSSWWVGYSGQ
jgi:hypothetical protein